MINPIARVLADSLNELAPAVRDHFSLESGRALYRGKMHRIWKKEGALRLIISPALHVASLSHTLLHDTGTDVPFELENCLRLTPDGIVGEMAWNRTFHFTNATRIFKNTTIYDDRRHMLLDRFGSNEYLEAELSLLVKEKRLIMTSGKARNKIGSLWLPLPRPLGAEAVVQEWQEQNGWLGISVTLMNPIVGEFFGYEGAFERVD